MNSGQASKLQTRGGDVLRRRGEESGLQAFLRARCINTQQVQQGYVGISNHQNATCTSTAQQMPGSNLLASGNGSYQGFNKNGDTNKENCHTPYDGWKYNSNLTFENMSSDGQHSVNQYAHSVYEEYISSNTPIGRGYEREKNSSAEQSAAHSLVLNNKDSTKSQTFSAIKHRRIPSFVQLNTPGTAGRRVPLKEIDLNQTSSSQVQGASSSATHAATDASGVYIPRRRGPGIATLLERKQSRNHKDADNAESVKNLYSQFEDAVDEYQTSDDEELDEGIKCPLLSFIT
ncbi:hypothetical protein ACET3Z_020272 [Daucus carota]